jgi:hypothetical protein
MSKINVIASSANVIFDDEGHPMSLGQEYSVTNSALIERYLSEGLLSPVVSAIESEQKEEVKKAVINKNSKTQEIVSTIPQENSNG